jgi:hypothetical protein
MTEINVAIAGATGWTGRAIVDGALAAPDITLTSAIARSSAGQDLGTALGREPLGVRVHGNVTEALDGVDVLVEFTSHTHAKEIALAAIEHAVAVVIGSSGMTAEDYPDIDTAARAAGHGHHGERLHEVGRRPGEEGRAARAAPPARRGRAAGRPAPTVPQWCAGSSTSDAARLTITSPPFTSARSSSNSPRFSLTHSAASSFDSAAPASSR